MAKAGRKMKPGKRAKSNRPSRAGVPSFDKGSERTQAMQALYGTDGSDAIGRAYKAGLLGEGSEAKALLDTARRLANAYWQAYATGTYVCPLGIRTFGSTASLDHERIKRREEWLSGCLDEVSRMGARRQFDQLVIDVHPDSGPAWLDSLIWNAQLNTKRRQYVPPPPCDVLALSAALEALEALVS